MAEIESGMTAYDLAKVETLQAPVLSKEEINKVINETVIPFLKGTDQQYYMLLNNENKDYTIFNLTSDREASYPTVAVDILECFENRFFDIIDVGLDSAAAAVEFWVRTAADEDKEAFVYYFFPCPQCVIEY